MGETKYPVLDPNFPLKIIGACRDSEERGLMKILLLTGMHISSVCSLGSGNMINQGSKVYLKWKRPKTNKTLQVLVPKDYLEDIQGFIKGYRRKSRQQYFNMVRAIGGRAGYQDISPMTFRHTRCIRALEDEGYSIYELPHLLGCSLDVVVRNYTKLREDQLSR
ncbi:MAG: tyrosine-type recombinase/integrase [Candidatus Thorarchaeota archaeon]